MLLQPDFLSLQPRLRIRRAGDTHWVYDPIRRREMVLTPEELLRQLVVLYLMEEKRYPPGRIRVEITVEWNGMKRRCDIVVFDAQLRPWLLVECKSPKVAVNQATFEQAARYNLQVQAPFLAVTNGLSTFCCRIDLAEGQFSYLDGFPDWPNST